MKKISIILSLVAIALCFASCKINRQDKLIGYWKVVPFTDPDSAAAVTYWIFYAGDRLEVYSLSTVDSLGNHTDISELTASQTQNKVEKSDSAIFASLSARHRGLVAGDTVRFSVFSYNTDGKIINIQMADETGGAKYIKGSHDICGKYWMDEIKKNKRLKLVRRKDPSGSKGGAYLRFEMVKIKG